MATEQVRTMALERICHEVLPSDRRDALWNPALWLANKEIVALYWDTREIVDVKSQVTKYDG